MKSKLHVVILIALMAALALPARAASAAGDEAEAKGAKCPSRVAVTVVALQPAPFAEYTRIAAQARPQVVAVASPVAGVLSEIRVSEGSLIDAGQDLAVLNAGMEAKLKALADDAAKKKKILTARQNWKEKSEKAIQAADRDYQAALALLEEGKALAGRAVQAPLAGIVRLKAETGAALEAGTPLFEIVDPLRLRLEAETASESLFVVGDTFEARAEGVQGVFAAEVTAVGGSKVSLLLDNRERKLEEGAVVSCAKLKARHEQALLVPAEAILQDSLGDFVFVAEKKNARKAYVTVSAREEGKAMIEKGLSAGALVIVSGLDCLADNKKIRVANAAEAAGNQAQAELKAQPVAAAAAGAPLDDAEKAKAAAAAAAKAEKEAKAAEAKAMKDEEKKAKAEAAAAAKAEKEAKAAEAKAMKDEEKKAKAEAVAAAKAKKEADKKAKADAAAAAKAAACPKRVEVRTEAAAPALFRAYHYFKAQALAEDIQVSAPQAGWIYALAVSEGTPVQAGAELFTLVTGGSEKTGALRREVERKAKVLADRREAKAAARSVQAADRDLQKAVSLLEKDIAPYLLAVSAPVAGVVKDIQAVPGADAAAAAPLLAVNSESSLLITLALPTAGELGFAKDETLAVQPVGREDALSAQVIAVDGEGAVLRLDNRDGRLKAGSSVIVRKLGSEHPDALTAPSQAVLKDSLGDFVYVMEKKKARKLYVGVGPSEAGRVLIEKGLAAGAQLIVSGFECLSDKKAVRLAAAAPERAAAGREEFIAYLEANREALGFARYEAVDWKGQPAVRIYSGRETQKKLLEALPRFAVSATTFELADGQIVSTVAFAGPQAAAAPETPVAPKALPAVKAPRLRVGLHGDFFLMLDANFKDTYGSLLGFGGELSYRFAQKLDFWVSGGMAGKKATPEWSNDEMSFSLIPLSAAVRYFLGGKGKLSPYVGAGANVFLVKDENPIADIQETLIGFHALGGCYYSLGRKLSAQLTAKFNVVSKDVVPDSDLDDPLSLMGLQLMLGVSYAL